MDNREHFEKQCTTCTQRWGGQCSSAHLQFIHTLRGCPLNKWNTHNPLKGKKPILWMSQDFAQGGITSFIDYAVPILADSDTPVLAVLHQSDFKYDRYRAQRVKKYCPTYQFGTEPPELFDQAEIITFSYVYSEEMPQYLIPKLSHKEYDSLVFQAHGDCVYTRQSVKNQRRLATNIRARTVWGMAPTAFSRSMMQEELGLEAEYVHPMYYGVEQEKYHVRSPRLFFPTGHRLCPTEPYRFICAGRLDPHKQFDHSAKLVKQFKQQGKDYKPFADARLTLVGDGWAKDQVLSSLAPFDFIDYIPWLDTEDLIEQLRQHDMMLMHSRSEGGPIITLEALSCGLPVHSTPVGLHQHLNELDPTASLFATTEQAPSLLQFAKHTNSPQSLTSRYDVIKSIKQLHSRVSLSFSLNGRAKPDF